MVDDPSPRPEFSSVPPAEKPFALRSIMYTIGFLAFILGVVPSLFYLVERAGSPLGTKAEIRYFWTQIRCLTGTAIFCIGLATYLFCSAWLIYFGRGPHVEFDPPKHFVATGPYRWVRNPVVLTLLTAGLGEAIALASIGILIFIALGIGFAHYQVTRIEEPRLRKRFGQSYIDYCSRVPRWIPRPPADCAG